MVKGKSNHPARGQIYWVELDPTVGTEIKKTRPCLIFSIDAYNKKMPRVIIIPITSQIQTVHPFQVLVAVDGKKGKVMSDQIRCVDKGRLKGIVGILSPEKMEEVANSIKLCMGI